MEKQFASSLQSQNEQFSTFIGALVERFEPEQIYCFGQRVDFSVKNSSFMDAVTNEDFHYYLLMVTKEATFNEHQVQEYANQHFSFGKVTILVHSKESFMKAINANSRFFITVNNEAQLLYSRNGMAQSINNVKYNPTNLTEKARKHFAHRVNLAHGFYVSAHECLKNECYSLCMHMLHQVVEQCCICLLRVHISYRTEIHNLNRLLDLCGCFSKVPMKLLSFDEKENKRVLDVLNKSYLAIRYKDNYSVKLEDLQQFFPIISVFLKLTIDMCDDKIKEYMCEDEVLNLEKTENELESVE